MSLISADLVGLNRFRQRIHAAAQIDDKVGRLLDSLANIAVQTIKRAYNDVISGNQTAFQTNGGAYNVNVSGRGNTRTVTVGGKEALFIEYGAGITFNTPQVERPSGVSNIGDYGYKQGRKKQWRYEVNGQTITTSGNPAAVGIPKAMAEMRLKLPSLVRGIWND